MRGTGLEGAVLPVFEAKGCMGAIMALSLSVQSQL